MFTVGINGQNVETGLLATVSLSSSSLWGTRRRKSLLAGGDGFFDSGNMGSLAEAGDFHRFCHMTERGDSTLCTSWFPGRWKMLRMLVITPWWLTSADRVESDPPCCWSLWRACVFGPQSEGCHWEPSMFPVWKTGAPTWRPGPVICQTSGGYTHLWWSRFRHGSEERRWICSPTAVAPTVLVGSPSPPQGGCVRSCAIVGESLYAFRPVHLIPPLLERLEQFGVLHTLSLRNGSYIYIDKILVISWIIHQHFCCQIARVAKMKQLADWHTSPIFFIFNVLSIKCVMALNTLWFHCIELDSILKAVLNAFASTILGTLLKINMKLLHLFSFVVTAHRSLYGCALMSVIVYLKVFVFACISACVLYHSGHASGLPTVPFSVKVTSPVVSGDI